MDGTQFIKLNFVISYNWHNFISFYLNLCYRSPNKVIKFVKMFPKWIDLLLKFYDVCGFNTETSKKTSKASRIFAVHSILAFTFSCFILIHAMCPVIVGNVLPYIVNELLQMMNGILTYWVIIIESYCQCETQRKFWKIYELIEKHQSRSKKSFLRIYLIKFVEFFGVITIVQIIFMQYYNEYVGNYIFFRIAYLFSQIIYQYRVFYFIFYLELVKYELQYIKTELKNIAELIDLNSVKSVKRRTKWCDTTMKELSENSLKEINANFQLVYELTKCINQVFGWSNCAIILYCFHLPLTDTNWAIWEIGKRSNRYVQGTKCSSKIRCDLAAMGGFLLF